MGNGICNMDDELKHLQKNLIKTRQMYSFEINLAGFKNLRGLKLQSFNFLRTYRLIN